MGAEAGGGGGGVEGKGVFFERFFEILLGPHKLLCFVWDSLQLYDDWRGERTATLPVCKFTHLNVRFWLFAIRIGHIRAFAHRGAICNSHSRFRQSAIRARFSVYLANRLNVLIDCLGALINKGEGGEERDEKG